MVLLVKYWWGQIGSSLLRLTGRFFSLRHEQGNMLMKEKYFPNISGS